MTLKRVASPVRRRPPLAARAIRLERTLIRMVEQSLDLHPRQRADLRTRLRLDHVRGGVPLVENLDRMRAKHLHGPLAPPVTRVHEVVAEQRNGLLVGAHGRSGHRPGLRHQMRRPVLDIHGAPLPRHRTAELHESANLPVPRVDRGEVQRPSPLLIGEPLQHLLDEGVSRRDRVSRRPERQDERAHVPVVIHHMSQHTSNA